MTEYCSCGCKARIRDPNFAIESKDGKPINYECWHRMLNERKVK